MSTNGLRKWALMLTFWLALHSKSLQAADQTVSGDLTVTGTSDFQGDALTFGKRTDNSNPGFEMVYTDDSTSILEFNASRSANIWKWQLNGGTALRMQMSLDGDNALRLYDQASPPVARITLDPLGLSTFEDSLTINGTDNQMPNQVLNGPASILTKELADERYISNSDFVIGSVPNPWNATLTDHTIGLLGGTASGANTFACGTGAVATGYQTVALGCNVSASAQYSTALGYGTTASGYYSTSLGARTTASGYFSVAMGSDSVASGLTSLAFGRYCMASGRDSVAIGGAASASDVGSLALGTGASASGMYAVAVGTSSSTGLGSIALGYASSASGDYAFAGGTSHASGGGSVALGTSTASQPQASAIGFMSTASAPLSTAIGAYVKADSYGSTAMGLNNVGGGSRDEWILTDPLFEIGNGYGDTALPSSALIIYKNGNAALQGGMTTGGGIAAGGVITSQPGGDIPMYGGINQLMRPNWPPVKCNEM